MYIIVEEIFSIPHVGRVKQDMMCSELNPLSPTGPGKVT